MAREIQATPIIKGQDAINFYRRLEENRYKKADTSTMQRIAQSVRFLNLDLTPLINAKR
jgi:hypothetical protein